MRPPFDRAAFEVDGHRYRWGDAALAAAVRGEWTALERDLRDGMACARRADREGDPVPSARLDEAADAFRYAIDLYSAEETEAWLAGRELSLDAWRSFVRRRVLRGAYADDLDRTRAREPVSGEEVAAELWAEGRCSGALDAFAERLARGAAVAAELAADQAPSHHAASAASPAEDVSIPALEMDEPDRLASLARIRELELAEQRLRDRVVTAEAVEQEVARRHLDWAHLDVRYLWFPELSMATEAELQLREDGVPMQEVAARAVTTVHEASWFLVDVEASLSYALIGAQRGQLVGPVELGEGFAVLQVDERVAPAASDPVVRARAEERIMSTAMAAAANDRVRWLEASHAGAEDTA